MSTMDIFLPDSMKRFVDQQVRKGDYADASDHAYVLIRRDRDAAKLRALLDDGGASPVEGEFDRAFFDGLRESLRTRASGAKRLVLGVLRPAATRLRQVWCRWLGSFDA